MPLPPRPLPREEKGPQHVGRRLGGRRELVLDARLDADAPPALAQRRRLALERRRQIARVDQQPAAVVGLDRLEVGHLVERQRHLVGVEDLEQRHVVAARAELPQPIGQVGRRVEQVGEEHDQALADRPARRRRPARVPARCAPPE